VSFRMPSFVKPSAGIKKALRYVANFTFCAVQQIGLNMAVMRKHCQCFAVGGRAKAMKTEAASCLMLSHSNVVLMNQTLHSCLGIQTEHNHEYTNKV
jgi:hypothetical protein